MTARATLAVLIALAVAGRSARAQENAPGPAGPGVASTAPAPSAPLPSAPLPSAPENAPDPAVRGIALRAVPADSVPTGLQLGGVPALSYDADNGFGYGAALELYDYGRGAQPYRYTVQPRLVFSTGGGRELSVFLDAPELLAEGWRLDGFAGTERQRFQPYYGIGNATTYDPALESGANPDWYAYDRTRTQLLLDVQRRVPGHPVRLLVGAGVARVTVNPVPREGTTLLAEQWHWTPGMPRFVGWSNFLRAGIIQDTRDREIDPRRGIWSDLLVQYVSEWLGSTTEYARWTYADRRYFSLGRRLTLANRALLQYVTGHPPFWDRTLVQTTLRQLEGLGGAKTLRGIPLDRYVDDGLVLDNVELRWRAGDFAALGRDWHLVLSGFVDGGRVWSGNEISFDDLHFGWGGGLHLRMGESFVVAADAAHSSEATLPVYVGLGFLY